MTAPGDRIYREGEEYQYVRASGTARGYGRIRQDHLVCWVDRSRQTVRAFRKGDTLQDVAGVAAGNPKPGWHFFIRITHVKIEVVCD